MENKKTKKFKDNLPIEGKIPTKPMSEEKFKLTLKALLHTPPPQKDKRMIKKK